MRNIQGKVQFEVLNELFNLGHLPNPEVLTKQITVAMTKYNTEVLALLKSNKPSLLGKLLGKEEIKKSPTFFHKPADFIRALKRSSTPFGVVADKDSLIDLWHKIQDIRTVLEVRCVAKNSQSNNVIADRDTLLTLTRVLDNKEDYLNL